MRGILSYDSILIFEHVPLFVIYVLFTLCFWETYFMTNYYDVINITTKKDNCKCCICHWTIFIFSDAPSGLTKNGNDLLLNNNLK